MVMSRSRHAFFCSTTRAQTQKIEYAYFERWEKLLVIKVITLVVIGGSLE